MEDRKMKRQGDVIFIPTTTKPETRPLPPDARGMVVAEGEFSGHHHAITGDAALMAFADTSGQMFAEVGPGGARVEVVGGGTAEFPRHTPISLEPGMYRITVQQTWTSGRAQRVAD